MIYVTEDYNNLNDKIHDNMDFFIWVNLFCIFLLVLGLFSGDFYNWILGSIVILFAVFYEFYLWVKLTKVKVKIALTDYGIRGDRIHLSSKFNKNSSLGHADEFYVVYSELIGYKIKDNNSIKLINKMQNNFDDLDYRFTNFTPENLALIIETFEKFGVKKLD
jgi:hypothetical protein